MIDMKQVAIISILVTINLLIIGIMVNILYKIYFDWRSKIAERRLKEMLGSEGFNQIMRDIKKTLIQETEDNDIDEDE